MMAQWAITVEDILNALQVGNVTESLIYRATVNPNDPKTKETYVGLCGGTFKSRFNQHKSDFNLRSKEKSTTLSQYIWSLKDKGIPYEVKWEKVCKAPTYNPNSKRCLLCLTEKYFILYFKDMASLNTRSEISNTCRHRRKFLLG